MCMRRESIGERTRTTYSKWKDVDETDYLAFGLFYTHFLSLVSFSSSET